MESIATSTDDVLVTVALKRNKTTRGAAKTFQAAGSIDGAEHSRYYRLPSTCQQHLTPADPSPCPATPSCGSLSLGLALGLWRVGVGIMVRVELRRVRVRFRVVVGVRER